LVNKNIGYISLIYVNDIYRANPVPKLTKLYDSNFIVCMLYKQVY